ncbi:MAG: GHKL domain-containing protein [Eggerthellaceae bacterium]|jgi:hypothetical protein|nr:GHKL domain-containing protein [Eggerthellaceae bacterium]MCH4221067.1 GHKL domain-containing protein [Eggerthellaceae bacterium]
MIDPQLAEYTISMLFLLSYLLLMLPMRYSKRVSIICAAVCFAITVAIDAEFTPWNNTDLMTGAVTICEAILVQGLAFFLCSYRDFRALFTGLTSAAYVLVGNIVFSVIYLVSGIGWLACLFQICLHTFLLVVIVMMLRKRYLYEMNVRSNGWGMLCLVPLMFYTTQYFLLSLESSPSLKVLIPCLCVLVLMILSYSIVIGALIDARHESELERDNGILARMTDNLKQQIELIQDSNERMTVIRHDMRHRVALINAYLDAKEYGRIRDLLSHLSGELDKAVLSRLSRNAALDAVLSLYSKRAEQAHVTMKCRVGVPEDLTSIDEVEYATTLSNLLENAVRAASEVEDPTKRFITCSISIVNHQMITEVSNSYVGDIKMNAQTHLPLSSQGSGHGVGLLSIKSYVGKQDGLFDLSCKDNVFTVRISLRFGE